MANERDCWDGSADQPLAASDPARRVTKTLLVVDDEPVNLELIRMVVDEFDLPVECVTAENGIQALELADRLAPVVILMDLKIPVLDGWEAARRLKANPATAGIPVIALTAQAINGDRERALATGCDRYITKPIDVRALVAVLREYLP